MTYRSRRRARVRRNPVRQRSDGRWDVIKPDGSVDLTLGDEQAARRLAAACGYDVAPTPAAPRKPIAAPRKAAAPRKPAAPRKAAPRKAAAPAKSEFGVPSYEDWKSFSYEEKRRERDDARRLCAEFEDWAEKRKQLEWSEELPEYLKKHRVKEVRGRKGCKTESGIKYLDQMREAEKPIDKLREQIAVAEKYFSRFGQQLHPRFGRNSKKKSAHELLRNAEAAWAESEHSLRRGHHFLDAGNRDLTKAVRKINDFFNDTFREYIVGKRKLTGEKGPFLDEFKLVIDDPDGNEDEETADNMWYLEKECSRAYDYYGYDYDCTYYWREFGGEWQRFDKAAWKRLEALRSRQNYIPRVNPYRPRKRRRR